MTIAFPLVVFDSSIDEIMRWCGDEEGRNVRCVTLLLLLFIHRGPPSVPVKCMPMYMLHIMVIVGCVFSRVVMGNATFSKLSHNSRVGAMRRRCYSVNALYTDWILDGTSCDTLWQADIDTVVKMRRCQIGLTCFSLLAGLLTFLIVNSVSNLLFAVIDNESRLQSPFEQRKGRTKSFLIWTADFGCPLPSLACTWLSLVTLLLELSCPLRVHVVKCDAND